MSKRTKKIKRAKKVLGDFVEHGPALEGLHKYMTMDEMKKKRVLSTKTKGGTPKCEDKCDCDAPPHNVVDETKWKACEGACTAVCPQRIQDELIQLLDQWDQQQQMGDLLNPATWSRLKRLVELGADINAFDRNEISFLHAAVSTLDVALVRWGVDHGAQIYLRSAFGENAFDILGAHPGVEVGRYLLGLDTRDLPLQWFLAFVTQIHNDVDQAFVEMVNEMDPHVE